ncbi:Protein of unknown function (DUF4232) [Frankia torreyi]|uniref:DUF4232 domain-containing protein n=1 Tax=Frankia torreyi TaxID=1856 RepID=A0A0D8BID2_9ACTN|nr:Protein of unknown function (DUF4232) [Frankia torreyi]
MHRLQTRSVPIPVRPDRAPALPADRMASRPPRPGEPGSRPTPAPASRAALLVAAVTLLLAAGCAGSSAGGKAPATVTAPRGGPPAGWSPALTTPALTTPAPTMPAPTTPGTRGPAAQTAAELGAAGTTGAGAAASASRTPAGSVTAPAGGLCPTARLAVRSADGEGAAGSTYEHLVLTNAGTTSCVLRGFPGVSYLDAAGRQVGAAAVRSGPAGQVVRLAPGASARATLRTVHPGIQEGCDEPAQRTPVAALRIFPPANTTALRLALSDVSACSSPAVQQLSVTAFTR